MKETQEVRICEGIAGMWHYHLTVDPHSSVSLCGKRAMYSGAPLNSWGFIPAHMPTSYCKRCEEIYESGASDEKAE